MLTNNKYEQKIFFISKTIIDNIERVKEHYDMSTDEVMSALDNEQFQVFSSSIDYLDFIVGDDDNVMDYLDIRLEENDEGDIVPMGYIDIESRDELLVISEQEIIHRIV